MDLARELGQRLTLAVPFDGANSAGASSVESGSTNGGEDGLSSVSSAAGYAAAVRRAAMAVASNAPAVAVSGTSHVTTTHYISSTHSTVSSSSATNSSVEAPTATGTIQRRPRKTSQSRGEKTASVSAARLSSVVVQRHSQDLSQFHLPPPSPSPPLPPPPEPHRTPSPTESGSGEGKDLSVTDADVRAIDSCLRGHRTRVFICGSLANLYTSSSSSSEWTLRLTGIPVLLMDSGVTRARRRRQLQILLVEKGTCFVLWRDVVDGLTGYAAESEAFHILRTSADHRQRVGLSFDCASSAAEFLGCVGNLTADPRNVSLAQSALAVGSKKNSRRAARKWREEQEEALRTARAAKPNSKAEISLPCAFQHVVRVSSSDAARYFSLQAFVDRGLKRSVGSAPHLRPASTAVSTTPAPAQPYRHPKLAVYRSCEELQC